MSASEAPGLAAPSVMSSRKTTFRRVVLVAAITLLFLTCGTEGYLLYRNQKQLRSEVRKEKWERLVSEYYLSTDSIAPQVGTIQFLKNGLSVTFNSATYTANGLELTGELGNARQISISSITLHITALHPMYARREKFLAGEEFSYTIEGNNLVLAGSEIGNGQTAVADLLPGRKQLFSLTIPNVKQGEEQPDLHASISGERYAY